jgi:hypothetical protein
MQAKIYPATAFLAFAALLSGQSYPPAQGPPFVSGANIAEFQVSRWLTGPMKIEIDKKLDEINARLAEPGDFHARVSISEVKAYNPILWQTEYPDRPNHRYVGVDHIVKLRVSDISYKGYPYPWGRSISISVVLKVFCNGWELGTGTVAVRGESDPPYLDPDPPLSEEVVNGILGGWLVDYLNSKIRQALGSGGVFSVDFAGQCVSLGASGGSPDTHEDDLIRYNTPITRPGAPPGSEYQMPQMTVRPVRVKRLQAHRPGGGVVYDSVETPYLEVWSGFGHWSYQLPPMVELQEVVLPAPAIAVVPRPTSSTSLVVIANTIQNGGNSGTKDSAWRAFSSSSNFGSGIQTVAVRKTYWEPPQPPFTTKPTIITIPGYEITFEVVVPGTSPPIILR